MNAFEKLIRPAPTVKSRLHDCAGRRANVSTILRNFPRAIVSRIVTSLTGEPPNLPWISYDAARLLERKMAAKPCRVLEFGSGASTAWFAARASELHSVESDPAWKSLVSDRLAALTGVGAKVEYELRTTAAEYSTFRANAQGSFDIILIDGPWRHLCAKHHIAKLASDGILYLDNSDADTSCNEKGEIERTLFELRNFATEAGLQERVFTDFSPCALHASQGVMFAPSAMLGKLEDAGARK